MEIRNEAILHVRCPKCLALLNVESSDIELGNLGGVCKCPCCGKEILVTSNDITTHYVVNVVYKDKNGKERRIKDKKLWR